MSVGVLIFAFSGDIDYVSIAKQAALRAQQHLSLPVTLVSDQDHPGPWDQVIQLDRPQGSKRYWQDSDRVSTWINNGRSRALDITPYDVTLLIDADYWMGSDNLLSIVNSDNDFQCHRKFVDIPRPGTVQTRKFGNRASDMWWATVVKFKKTDYVKDIFYCWKMIEENYSHYSQMFEFDRRPFRNDYALSLALLIANGNTFNDRNEIPWPLINVLPEARVSFANDSCEIEYKKLINSEMKPYKFDLAGQDLHFMGKSYLDGKD